MSLSWCQFSLRKQGNEADGQYRMSPLPGDCLFITAGRIEVDFEGDRFDLFPGDWKTEDEHPACYRRQGDGENRFLGGGGEFFHGFRTCIDHLFLRHDDFYGVWRSSCPPALIQDFYIELQDFNIGRGGFYLANLKCDFSQSNNGFSLGARLGRTLSYPCEG